MNWQSERPCSPHIGVYTHTHTYTGLCEIYGDNKILPLLHFFIQPLLPHNLQWNPISHYIGIDLFFFFFCPPAKHLHKKKTRHKDDRPRETTAASIGFNGEVEQRRLGSRGSGFIEFGNTLTLTHSHSWEMCRINVAPSLSALSLEERVEAASLIWCHC